MLSQLLKVQIKAGGMEKNPGEGIKECYARCFSVLYLSSPLYIHMVKRKCKLFGEGGEILSQQVGPDFFF